MQYPGIRVRPHSPLEISQEIYPWINTPRAEIPTVAVMIDGGQEFVYGSMIRLSPTLAREADKVTIRDSEKLQGMLFQALKDTFRGIGHRAISKVENSALAGSRTLFTVSNNLIEGPNLLFVVDNTTSCGEGSLPSVLRVGIGACSNSKLVSLIGIRQSRGRRRNS